MEYNTEESGDAYRGACFPKYTEAFASFARNMNVKPDLIETAISINKQMKNLNSANLIVKEQLEKDHYINLKLKFVSIWFKTILL